MQTAHQSLRADTNALRQCTRLCPRIAVRVGAVNFDLLIPLLSGVGRATEAYLLFEGPRGGCMSPVDALGRFTTTPIRWRSSRANRCGCSRGGRAVRSGPNCMNRRFGASAVRSA